MKISKLLAHYFYVKEIEELKNETPIVKLMHTANRISLLMLLFSLMFIFARIITKIILHS